MTARFRSADVLACGFDHRPGGRSKTVTRPFTSKNSPKKGCKSQLLQVHVVAAGGNAGLVKSAQLKPWDPHPISCAKTLAEPLVLWFFPLQGLAIVVLIGKIMYLKNLTV